jgi:cytochrome c-type biogenesis protein CcsB
MIDQQLASTSDTLFWVTLVVYALAATFLLHHLAFRGARIGVIGTAIGWTGVIVHLGSIVTRGLAAGRVPWGNMYEYSSVLALLLVVGQLTYGDLRKGMRSLSGIAFTVALLWLGLARATTYVPARELQVSLNSIWLKIHVIAAIVAWSMFALSAIYSTLFLVKLRQGRRTIGSTVGAAHIDVFDEQRTDLAAPIPPGAGSRLPSAARLDELAHRTVQFAFPIWTFAVMAGAIWAHVAWGRYWGWDPKETWAFITWVVYAGYLHARATAGWRDRKAAILNVAAFGVVLFTYYGVNMLIDGLHSYKSG